MELVVPTDDTTGVARFLATKGEGFHHVCFEVDEPRRRRSPGSQFDGLELIDTRAAEGRGGPGRVHPPAAATASWWS